MTLFCKVRGISLSGSQIVRRLLRSGNNGFSDGLCSGDRFAISSLSTTDQQRRQGATVSRASAPPLTRKPLDRYCPWHGVFKESLSGFGMLTWSPRSKGFLRTL